MLKIISDEEYKLILEQYEEIYIPFGKFKENNLRYVLEGHPDYINWAIYIGKVEWFIKHIPIDVLCKRFSIGNQKKKEHTTIDIRKIKYTGYIPHNNSYLYNIDRNDNHLDQFIDENEYSLYDHDFLNK